MRTLVWLGALAVATAALGRTFGLHDWRFLASEMVLLASMFVISHYVLPLLARRDRGATGEEHVGGLLDCFCENRWFVIHDAIVGRGNIDHIVIGPAGVFTVETKSHPGPDAGVTRPRCHDRAGSRPAAGRRTDRGHRGGAADRLQPGLGGPAARAAQGRPPAARRGCCSGTSPSARDGSRARRSMPPTISSSRRCWRSRSTAWCGSCGTWPTNRP